MKLNHPVAAAVVLTSLVLGAMALAQQGAGPVSIVRSTSGSGGTSAGLYTRNDAGLMGYGPEVQSSEGGKYFYADAGSNATGMNGTIVVVNTQATGSSNVAFGNPETGVTAPTIGGFVGYNEQSVAAGTTGHAILAAGVGRGVRLTTNGAINLDCHGQSCGIGGTVGAPATATLLIGDIGVTGINIAVTSGNDALTIATNGGRLSLGTGADDYFTSDGTRIVAAGRLGVTDAVEVPSNTGTLYLDGTSRSVGFGVRGAGTRIAVQGALPLSPNADQGINLGEAGVRWSNAFLAAINMGTSGALTWSITNPSAITACTTPTRTNGNTLSAQYDVGTTCAGVSTIVLTVTAATNGWECWGRTITNGGTHYMAQTGAVSTTSVTMTKFSRTTGLAVDFNDGEDVTVNCTGR